MRPMDTAPRDRPILVYGKMTGEVNGDRNEPEWVVAEFDGFGVRVCATEYYSVLCHDPLGWEELPNVYYETEV